MPTLLFRNNWSWSDGGAKPVLSYIDAKGQKIVHAHHNDALFQKFLDDYYLYCVGDMPLLFTENETNQERLFARPNASPYVKDGFDRYLVHSQQDAINPQQTGTKAAPLYQLSVAAGAQQTIRLRLSRNAPVKDGKPFAHCPAITASIRSSSSTTVRNRESTTCSAIRIPACSAAIPTGGAQSGCQSTSSLRLAVAALRLLR